MKPDLTDEELIEMTAKMKPFAEAITQRVFAVMYEEMNKDPLTGENKSIFLPMLSAEMLFKMGWMLGSIYGSGPKQIPLMMATNSQFRNGWQAANSSLLGTVQ